MDLIQDLYKTFAERLKNPLFCSLLFSLLALNWKGGVYIFASVEPIEVRLDKFSSYALAPWWTALLFSAGYVIILPWINWIIDKLTNYVTTQRKVGTITCNAQVEESRERLVLAEAKNEETRSNLGTLEERAKTIEEQQKQIEELEGSSKELRDNLSQADLEMSKMAAKHTDLALEMEDNSKKLKDRIVSMQEGRDQMISQNEELSISLETQSHKLNDSMARKQEEIAALIETNSVLEIKLNESRAHQNYEINEAGSLGETLKDISVGLSTTIDNTIKIMQEIFPQFNPDRLLHSTNTIKDYSVELRRISDLLTEKRKSLMLGEDSKYQDFQIRHKGLKMGSKGGAEPGHR
ncbi:hypothetical protein ACWPKO_10190 [Coraliomargarita sp. W4R53]